MTEKTQDKKQLGPVEVLELAEELVGGYSNEIYLDDRGNLIIILDASMLSVLVRALRDDARLSFRYLVYVTATDYEDRMEALYLLRSVDHGVPVELRAELDRDKPHIPSLALLYSTACWHERESYDMFGIIYDGHPELTRILTGRKEEMYPLRKDARPKRQSRSEWQFKGIPPAIRLPGARDRSERS
jgi:NADH-quinone oxidoreductase subunit C